MTRVRSLSLLLLTPALALAAPADSPSPAPIAWGRVLPDTITIEARKHRRRYSRDLDGDEVLDRDRLEQTTASLKRLSGRERYRGEARSSSESLLKDLAEEDLLRRSPGDRTVTGQVSHNLGRWLSPSSARGLDAPLPALNRASALRELIPKDRAPKLGEEWSLPFARFRKLFGLDEDVALETEEKARLRFVGLRRVTGQVCQVYSLRFEAEEATSSRVEVSLRLSGLLVVEQRSGVPRLFNLGLHRRRRELQQRRGVLGWSELHVVLRIRERTAATKTRPKKKP